MKEETIYREAYSPMVEAQKLSKSGKNNTIRQVWCSFSETLPKGNEAKWWMEQNCVAQVKSQRRDRWNRGIRDNSSLRAGVELCIPRLG